MVTPWLIVRCGLLILVLGILVRCTALKHPRGQARVDLKLRSHDQNQPVFYLFTLEELNATMGHCQLSIYGEALYQHLLVHPRRTSNSKVAKLGIMPPFMADERHWPWYGKPGDNIAKRGADCYTATMVEARKLNKEYIADNKLPTGFFITLVDMDPHWFHQLDSAANSDPLFSWARLNLLDKDWRRKRDISMPPPATERLRRYKSDMRDMSKKKYWMTFQGSFRSHPIRANLAKLHNPEAGIIISDTSKSFFTPFGRHRYDYDDLMSSSKFTLVVRGEAEYSYRFTEAVCSGAVPVLLADSWVPPFSTLVPLQTYGVHIQEKDWHFLVQHLRGIDDQTWLDMQQSALAFCHNHLVSVHHQFQTMLDILLSNKIE